MVGHVVTLCGHLLSNATLADAQFVGAFDAADKVYFVLREIAIEQINCAKVCSAAADVHLCVFLKNK